MIKKTSTARFMAALILFSLVFGALCFGMAYISKGYFEELWNRNTAVISTNNIKTLIIDPGHGGEDGGCSAGATLEKDLNLFISQNIHDMCTFFGIPSKLTREEDTLLYDMYGDLSDYKGKKKVYDLKNRVKFTKSEGDVYLGIHMNKFPQSRYSGLQVYYSASNKESRPFAEKIQSCTKEYIQTDNTREVKKSSSSIYILSKLECPAVLVECGFLSNERELELLRYEGYRAELSLGIFTSTAEFILGTN